MIRNHHRFIRIRDAKKCSGRHSAAIIIDIVLIKCRRHLKRLQAGEIAGKQWSINHLVTGDDQLLNAAAAVKRITIHRQLFADIQDNSGQTGISAESIVLQSLNTAGDGHHTLQPGASAKSVCANRS